MRGRFATIACLMALFLSCNTVKLTDARDHFIRGEYQAATEAYQKLYQKTPREQHALRGVIAFEMAENYRKLNQSSRALTAYRNAIRYKYPDTIVYFHLARMLHREGNYEEAHKAYQDFLAQMPEHSLAKAGLKGVEMAQSDRVTSPRYTINQETVFASNRDDVSPMLARRDDRLYFTSTREGDQADLFYSDTNVHGVWQPPRKVASSVNSPGDERSATFSPDGEWMYYTANNRIFVSRSVNGSWSGGWPLDFGEIDAHWSFSHPAPSPCGNWLYFVSNMPGGYGGKDIWRGRLQGSDRVLFVENLGGTINTPGDEVSPYIQRDTVIYFSSDGHPGYGGLDLFRATKQRDTSQWRVQHMGAPLNSSADDFGITFSKEEGEKGFFCSNRDNPRGYHQIYSFSRLEPTIMIEGIVVTPLDELIPLATVRVTGSDDTQQFFITNREGEYRFTAAPEVSYLFEASVEGYHTAHQRLGPFPLGTDTLIYVDFELEQIDFPK